MAEQISMQQAQSASMETTTTTLHLVDNDAAIGPTTKKKDFNGGYVIDEDRLRRLDTLLAEVAPKRAWTITFSDDSVREFYDIAPVLALENAPQRRITQISVYGRITRDSRIFLRFSPFPSSYDIHAEDKTALHLAERLDECFEAAKQWYAPVTRFNKGHNILYITTLMSLGWGTSMFTIVALENHHVPVWLSILIGASIQVAIALLFNYVTYRIFPFSVFAIGHGKERQSRITSIRNVVGISIIIGIIVGVAGSLTASYLYDYFKR